jgi:RNase H-like domain found in reverse transcriptase/Reverse transcriptase (RNA-dependent DNA polymerase)/Retroviral aspartyl protease
MINEQNLVAHALFNAPPRAQAPRERFYDCAQRHGNFRRDVNQGRYANGRQGQANYRGRNNQKGRPFNHRINNSGRQDQMYQRNGSRNQQRNGYTVDRSNGTTRATVGPNLTAVNVAHTPIMPTTPLPPGMPAPIQGRVSTTQRSGSSRGRGRRSSHGRRSNHGRGNNLNINLAELEDLDGSSDDEFGDQRSDFSPSVEDNTLNIHMASMYPAYNKRPKPRNDDEDSVEIGYGSDTADLRSFPVNIEEPIEEDNANANASADYKSDLEAGGSQGYESDAETETEYIYDENRQVLEPEELAAEAERRGQGYAHFRMVTKLDGSTDFVTERFFDSDPETTPEYWQQFTDDNGKLDMTRCFYHIDKLGNARLYPKTSMEAPPTTFKTHVDRLVEKGVLDTADGRVPQKGVLDTADGIVPPSKYVFILPKPNEASNEEDKKPAAVERPIVPPGVDPNVRFEEMLELPTLKERPPLPNCMKADIRLHDIETLRAHKKEETQRLVREGMLEPSRAKFLNTKPPIPTEINVRKTPSPPLTQPQAMDSEEAMELARRDIEERKTMTKVDSSDALYETDDSGNKPFKPCPTYEEYRRRHSKLFFYPENGELKELALFDKLLERVPAMPDTVDVHDYIERMVGPLIRRVAGESAVCINNETDLVDVINSLETQGPLYETVGATMVVMTHQVFQRWTYKCKQFAAFGKQDFINVTWQKQFEIYKPFYQYNRYDTRAGAYSRALQQLERDNKIFGEGTFERICLADELEDIQNRMYDDRVLSDEIYSTYMDYPEFYSINYANINLHEGRMRELQAIYAYCKEKAFAIWRTFWYAFGNADSHDPLTGYRLQYRGENGRDRGFHRYPRLVRIEAPPEPNMPLEAALLMTNPTGGVNPREPIPFSFWQGRDQVEEYWKGRIDKPESIFEPKSFDADEYPWFTDSLTRPHSARVYKGAAARALQQYAKDCVKFGKPKTPTMYFAEPTDIVEAAQEAGRHKGMNSEFFEHGFGTLAMHPVRIEQLEELRATDPTLGQLCYEVAWHAFGTMDSHHPFTGKIMAYRRPHKNYKGVQYRIIVPKEPTLGFHAMLEITTPPCKPAPDMPITTMDDNRGVPMAHFHVNAAGEVNEQAVGNLTFPGMSVHCYACATNEAEPESRHSHRRPSAQRKITREMLVAILKRCMERTTTLLHEVMNGNADATCAYILRSRDLGLSLLPSEAEQCIDFSKLSPSTILIIDRIQGKAVRQPFHALFDSGSDGTLIRRNAIPVDIHISRLDITRIVNGVTGAGTITHKVTLEDLVLPELHPTMRIVKPTECFVVDDLVNCDLLLGRDFMEAYGVDILFSTKEVRWMDYTIPFRPAYSLNNRFNLYGAILEAYLHDDIVPKGIEAAKYEKHDTDKIAKAQIHLNWQQRKQLAKLLRKFPTLFDGKLRIFPNHTVHLELLPGSSPRHLAPYPVAVSNRVAFKEELERLVRIGVLERCGVTEWALPTFIIPKKDGTVRWVSDFRELNKCIKRKIYPLSSIQEILTKRSGYEFFTKLDLSMAYYTYELDEESKNLCVIITPFGKYRYTRLPMGVKCSPDEAQQVLESLLRHVEECDVYIDDIGIFDNSWEQHLRTLDKVLTILCKHNFAVNPLKVEWARKETDWLGYWLTPTGLKPCKKKIEAILQLARPQTLKQLRAFLGAVTYYRDMFPQRSHILAPLTELSKCTSKVIPWGPEQAKAFETMKSVMAKDVLLRYPDHNKPFHVYANASDYQLGAIIMQEGAPVAYYSRKLTSAQRNYTTMEKELLSIVETLREYRTMLFGCRDLHIYTDHRNLTFNKLNSQRVTRWRLFLEEFAPKFQFIKGSDNNIADALSRLPRADDNDVETVTVSELFTPAVTSAQVPRQEHGAKKRLPRNDDAMNFGQRKIQRSNAPRRLETMDCLVALPKNFPPTIIDTVTNFCEVVQVKQMDARHIALQFRNAWLCRYPKPVACIFDQGSEFKAEFRMLLNQYSIRARPITAKNPQSNGIVEHLHQTMANSIRTMLASRRHAENEAEADMLVDTVLQLSAYSARATVHSILKVTPGALAFQRDMILNIPIHADYERLRDLKQAAIDTQLLRANKSRTPHDYQPGDKIMVLATDPTKLQPRATGPFKIRYVHTNGTVTYFKKPTITERINIHRIKPYVARSQNG